MWKGKLSTLSRKVPAAAGTAVPRAAAASLHCPRMHDPRLGLGKEHTTALVSGTGRVHQARISVSLWGNVALLAYTKPYNTRAQDRQGPQEEICSSA